MEKILVLAQIIVLLSLSALAIYFVVVLTKLKDLLGTIETNIKEVSTRAIPVLEHMEVITSKFRSVAENIDDQLTILRGSVESLRTITDNVVAFERRLQETIETPVLEVLSTVGGFIRGLSTFLNKLRGR